MTDFHAMSLLHWIISSSPPGAQQLMPVVVTSSSQMWFIAVNKTRSGEDAIGKSRRPLSKATVQDRQCGAHDVWNERVKLFLTFGYNEIMTGRKLCHFSMKMLVQILSFLPSYFLYNASTIAKMTDIWQVSVSIQPRQLIKVFLSMHQLSQRQKPISIDYFAD